MTNVIPFQIKKNYKKNDIYRILSVELEKQRGIWDTGYTKYQNDWFIFANIGVAGTTGHHYGNSFTKDGDLRWYAKNNAKYTHESIKSLLKPQGNIYIFYREDAKKPFTFAGFGRVKCINSKDPVVLTWQLSECLEENMGMLAEEVIDPKEYLEGATKQIFINVYERNSVARKKCLDYYGYNCSVCDFNFEKIFGDLGKEFIHVHHLVPLANIKKEYVLDPIQDLKPVCPNCHTMIHRKDPILSVEELKQVVREYKK